MLLHVPRHFPLKRIPYSQGTSQASVPVCRWCLFSSENPTLSPFSQLKHKLGILSGTGTPTLHHALHNTSYNEKQFHNKALNQTCSVEKPVCVVGIAHAGSCLCPSHSLSCPQHVRALHCTTSTGNSCTCKLTCHSTIIKTKRSHLGQEYFLISPNCSKFHLRRDQRLLSSILFLSSLPQISPLQEHGCFASFISTKECPLQKS